MKHNLFLTTMLAAALMGGQVFAETVYRVSEQADDAEILVADGKEATIIVDTQKTLSFIAAARAQSLTLDYQGDFVLMSAAMLDTPDHGVLNITSTVDTVATAWEDAFSVAEGGTITLCHADDIEDLYGPVQFLGKEANNTVQLGNTEVMFVGIVEALSALDMNQVGVVWGKMEMTLVGKVEKSVPEPATGTLSLLALAGLCARRRRK